MDKDMFLYKKKELKYVYNIVFMFSLFILARKVKEPIHEKKGFHLRLIQYISKKECAT